MARYSGAVLVADIENLSNLLGESPEWFEACPQVQQAHDGGFLSLEVTLHGQYGDEAACCAVNSTFCPLSLGSR